MGADNYAVCPACYNKESDRIAKVEADLKIMYGTVPIEEYEKKKEELPRKNVSTNLREVYMVGIRQDICDGSFQFEVEYSGHCGYCGYTKKFTHYDPIEGEDS